MLLKLTKNYKAILFDFDGVLGRTLEDNFLRGLMPWCCKCQ